tara:strand:- start:189 stop:815 length:627 start_codon:yes stop_codon:yes gene_type:complete
MAITIDGSSGIASVDGSAGSPSVRGTDANSGILYTADAIKFSTGGVQRAVIDNNGLSSAGHILQVLQNLKRDTTSSSSTSYVDTGLEQAITPASTSNKILIQYSIMFSTASSSIPSPFTQIVRGGSAITGAFPSDTSVSQYGTTTNFNEGNTSVWTAMTYLDSPSTTSETTYKIQYRVDGGSAVHINKYHNQDNYTCISQMTLMEVAG